MNQASKTIEVAIQRCVRRATRVFLQDFIYFYLWDNNEPVLRQLQDKILSMFLPLPPPFKSAVIPLLSSH